MRLGLILLATAAPAATLTAPARHAFDAYAATVEARLARQHSRPETYVASGRSGETTITPIRGGSWKVPGGLIHHWRGAALVPRAGAAGMLALLRDEDHLRKYYAPDIVASHILARHGDQATVAIRFKKQNIVTVVLDTEFETGSALAGQGRGYSFSRSTHIWQVQDAGTPEEHRRPEGDDDGYLWRLNSYWSFEERPEGLLIECEAVSLTRDIPLGLGWLVMPIVQSLPRASLEFTLDSTRKALARRQEDDRAN